ncbi:hypothetical protein Plhal304r1_c009g0037101 [Plasmopara halstedii]
MARLSSLFRKFQSATSNNAYPLVWCCHPSLHMSSLESFVDFFRLTPSVFVPRQ